MDSSSGDAAFLDDAEIVNSERTLTYLNNGYGPPSMTVNGGCSCPNVRELIGCDPEPYTTPTLDPAPWYDPSRPESADFAGFYPSTFEGMGSTYTRTTFKKSSGGSVLGRLIPQERILTWHGFLFGRTCCAVQYGLRWLTQQLAGSDCGCENSELDLLVCCPDTVSGSIPCSGLTPTALPLPCPVSGFGDTPDAFRTLQDVGLLEGPTIISERKTGCGGGCGGGLNCAEESCIMEIEFSLVAGNPFLWGCPMLVCNDLQFPPPVTGCFDEATGCGDPDSGCIEWIELVPPATGCPPDPDETCPEPPDCTADNVLCPAPVLPIFPTIEDNCRCDPLDPVSVCCEVPVSTFGAFFDGVPYIEIFSGDKPMRAIHIRFFENPQELPCEDLDDCNVCDELVVRFIPANSTLVIDGTTRRVELICVGEQRVPADHLVTSPFSWPTLRCVNYCICFETEGIDLSTLATVSVVVHPREM